MSATGVSSGLIRVEADDARLAASLMERLGGLFEAGDVAVDQETNDVTLRTHGDPGKAVICVLDTVEAWLADVRRPSARIHLDGRSYTIAAGERAVNP